jgi:hypothetical protein
MIRYIVSVDLGKSQDYTAVVIVECESNPNTATTYAVRHLERYPIGTRYEDIRDSVCALMVRPPVFGASMLALDATGVGNSVRELFEPDTLERDYHALGLLPGDHHCRMCGDEWVSVSDATAYVRKSDADDQVARAAARVLALGDLERYPIIITGGAAVTFDRMTGSYNVPKRDLVSVTQLALQGGRLLIAQALPLAGLLRAELEGFRAKPTAAGHETYEAREGEHDDIVLALAQAVWVGERVGSALAEPVSS